MPDHLLAQTVRQASDFALSTQAAIANLGFTHDPLRFPANGSEAAAVGLPASAIGFRFLRDCEMAFHLASAPATACQVVGVEIGGWDTHTTQVSQRTVLDQWLAYGLRALYDLTRNLTETYTILVVSEFGRTNAVNAALGTDHGMGDLMIVMGRQANGGVYNCRPAGAGLGVASWVPIGGTFPFQNAQDLATDFRTVFWEVLRKRVLLTPADLQEIVPGYAVNVAGMPRTTELNCIN